MVSKKLVASGTIVNDLFSGQIEEVLMDALSSGGPVTLNAEGRQYAAFYQLRRGVITVTLGSASRVIRVGQAVAAPESLARTILRTMVRENSQLAESKRETRDH